MDPSEVVKTARTHLCMTQVELAEESGLSRQLIGHIEQGRKSVTYPVARKLAKPLRVAWRRLYTGPVPHRYKHKMEG